MHRSPPAARSLLALLAVVILCLACGCSGPEGQLIERWTLHTRDLSRPVRFPTHLNDELPNRIETYRLTAEVVLEAGLRRPRSRFSRSPICRRRLRCTSTVRWCRRRPTAAAPDP